MQVAHLQAQVCALTLQLQQQRRQQQEEEAVEDQASQSVASNGHASDMIAAPAVFHVSQPGAMTYNSHEQRQPSKPSFNSEVVGGCHALAGGGGEGRSDVACRASSSRFCSTSVQLI